MAKKNKGFERTLKVCICVGLVAIITAAVFIIRGIGKNPNGMEASSDGHSDTSSDASDPSSVETPSDDSSKTASSAESKGNGTEPYTKPDGNPVCYLTFDDGPSGKVTSSILATLARYDVKATFFVVGTGSMDKLQEISAAGHAIGLHSNTHEYNIYTSTDKYFADLQAVSDKVYEKTGIRSKIIRFPGGSSNTISKKYCVGIMTQLTRMVEEQGYTYVDWNVDSGDAETKTKDKDTIVQNVLNGAKGANGQPRESICVLMHDLNTKTLTAEALPEIIEGLRAMGYTFKTLDSNAHTFHHGVNN